MTEFPNDRHIRIEESAVGSAIVSGDGNIIYVIQQTIEQRREEPSTENASKIGPNPYKGLAAFKESDAARYFGREAQVKRLWQRFQELYEHQVDASPKVLSIVGPSGCGKSSLARAGFIPELARRPLLDKVKMRVAVLTPGARPLEALAGILAKTATDDPLPVEKAKEFERVLKDINDAGEYDGLRYITSLIPNIRDTPLVVLVDQFEEIYSLCKDTKQRRAFIDNLLLAASDPSGEVSVVITLRSDFLRETQCHELLNSVIGSDQTVIVPAMTMQELTRAIAEPAKKVRYYFDEAMVELLARDTKDSQGALPLLQFTLDQIWQALDKGKAPIETYRSIGGIGGALAEKAQQIFDKLDSIEKDIARRIFLGLVQIDESDRKIGRRTTIKELISHKDDFELVRKVIYKFSSSTTRLITLSNVSHRETQEITEIVELSHEALISNWNKLDEWFVDQRDLIHQHRKIEASAQEWYARNKDKTYLLQRQSLLKAKVFSGTHKEIFPLSEIALEYIRESTRYNRAKFLRLGGIFALFFAIVFLTLDPYFRDERVNTAREIINSEEGSIAERQSVLYLVKGCEAQKLSNWLPQSLREILFGNCRPLQGLNLAKANLRNLEQLVGADLSYADLSYADLSYADLSYADLSYANLSYADLSSSYLGSTVLVSSKMDFVNLSNADLFSTRMRDVSLHEANMMSAYLIHADLNYSELKGAIFENAYLNDVDFQDADFQDAILNNAIFQKVDLGDARNLEKEQIFESLLCDVRLPDYIYSGNENITKDCESLNSDS